MDRWEVPDITHPEQKVRESPGLRKLRILFVDSDPTAQLKMQYALENSFSVRCVASVREAKASLEMFIPDMLISEVVVDQESGLDLCRYIRHTPSLHHLPIMFLTSLTTLQDKVAGFDAGSDDYVVKPFDTRHLNARIRLLARIKRLERNATVQ